MGGDIVRELADLGGSAASVPRDTSQGGGSPAQWVEVNWVAGHVPRSGATLEQAALDNARPRSDGTQPSASSKAPSLAASLVHVPAGTAGTAATDKSPRSLRSNSAAPASSPRPDVPLKSFASADGAYVPPTPRLEGSDSRPHVVAYSSHAAAAAASPTPVAAGVHSEMPADDSPLTPPAPVSFNTGVPGRKGRLPPLTSIHSPRKA
jgi:hypothetical protein